MVNWLDELMAQIEAHGIQALTFYLADSDDGENNRDLELTITDVKFEDGNIAVTLDS